MNCITMLLNTSEVMAVRRAVFAAGASRVVVSPLSKQARAAHFQDWYFGKNNARCDAPIRIDVGVDESHEDDVVSAFLATAHVGQIERIARPPSKPKGIRLGLLHAA
jgi:hypothetical protein